MKSFKSFFRIPYVNNNIYLELAKLDYNNCQALHQQEWKDLQKWCRNSNLGVFGLSEGSLMQAYYVVAASIFESEKSLERLAWAKTVILMQTITSHFNSAEQKRAFIDEFERDSVLTYANGVRYKTRPNLVGILLRTLNQLSLDTLSAQGCNIHQPLKDATWEGRGGRDAELLVQTLNLSGRVRTESKELTSLHLKYDYLMQVTVSVCDKLRLFQHRKDRNGCMAGAGGITTLDIESAMQELGKLVVTKSAGDLDSQIKQNFFIIARSFYCSAYCNIGTINFHISKVLFERVQ
ncbi:ent-copalyl diphosphate synthase, chloroplastic-like [Salvia splendens]|uniref:ent-copalyl diphosphate synthase, chloroplastic-like n=1 Tax=Salvia splendens TaxID=180675 RepID=UPI001C27C27B|nr:ent-copalyl diphosphate synthase, chloroplastic-like [Salvia splendens]